MDATPDPTPANAARLAMLVSEIKNSDTIADALGVLWLRAPERRDEIKAFCLRTGLRITVDA